MVNKVTLKLFYQIFNFFVWSLILQSCSSQSFVSEGTIPIPISTTKNSENFFEKYMTSDSYFWGRSPEVARINLDEIVNELGLRGASFVTIEARFSWRSFLYTLVTLGLYCPQDFKISVRAKRELFN